MSIARGVDSALRVWDEIDHPNLKENTEPTKDRARLMPEKCPDHPVRNVRLRKLAPLTVTLTYLLRLRLALQGRVDEDRAFGRVHHLC